MTDVKLDHPGGQLSMAVREAVEGPGGIDVSALLKETGYVTLDQGFVNTASTTSSITYIDGDAGILRYRGFPIEQLAEKSTFLEVSYLLMHDELPTPQQLKDFGDKIRVHTLLQEEMRAFFSGFPRDAHPMAVLSSAVTALSTFYQDALDPLDAEQVEISGIRLMAKIPTIAAYAYKRSIGHPLPYPDNSLDYVANFLRMTFGLPTVQYDVDPTLAKVLDMLFILHADHEQNCSTSTVRLVGSSGANLYASIAAGILALWGPLHGGANQAVIEMLEEIKNSGQSYKDFLDDVKNKRGNRRLMGFGHRVYKNFDPRAKILKKMCDEVLAHLGVKDPLLDIAKSMEEVALKDDYFISKKLYPNVDFYSGIIYRALGIPTNMFTVMFALGRLPGWIAHWKEMVEDKDTKIGRPRQIYTGHRVRKYVPIDQRG